LTRDEGKRENQRTAKEKPYGTDDTEFRVLIAYLNQAILQLEDPRQTSNATKYSLKDAVLAAFPSSYANASLSRHTSGIKKVIMATVMLEACLG